MQLHTELTIRHGLGVHQMHVLVTIAKTWGERGFCPLRIEDSIGAIYVLSDAPELGKSFRVQNEIYVSLQIILRLF